MKPAVFTISRILIGSMSIQLYERGHTSAVDGDPAVKVAQGQADS